MNNTETATAVPSSQQDLSPSPTTGENASPSPIPADAEALALLRQMESNIARQLRYTKIFTLLCAIMLALVVVICVVLLPRLNTILQDVNTLMTQATSIAGDLEILTKEILDADIGGILSDASKLVKNTDAGVQQSLQELQQALEKLNSLDFEGLNQSIADLQAIVEPLSKLFGGR